MHAEERLGELDRTAADPTEDRRDRIGARVQRDSLEDAVQRGVDEPQRRGRVGVGRTARLQLGDLLAELPTDHRFDHRRPIEAGNRPAGGDVAVAEDHDVIGEGVDLVEPVGDVDDRHASVAQAADEREQPLDLLGGERRGRFVEHQQSGRSSHRPGDLEDLTLGHTELAHRLTGVEVDVELPQDLHGTLLDGSPADEPTAAGQRAEGDVLGNRQVGSVGELLVDDPESEVAGNPRVAHVDNLAIHRDRAGVGAIVTGEHLDRRRLARSVLAEQCQNASAAYRQVDTVQHLDAAERLAQTGRS